MYYKIETSKNDNLIFRIMMTESNWAKVEEAARNFLYWADKLNGKVSAYFNGSYKAEDTKAYLKLKDLDRQMVDAYNEYWGERNAFYGLNYEIAEYILTGEL